MLLEGDKVQRLRLFGEIGNLKPIWTVALDAIETGKSNGDLAPQHPEAKRSAKPQLL
jgi:hypothetical protein